MAENVLGIDIGGTNITFGIIHSSGDIIYKNSFKTAHFSSPDDFVKALYLHFQETDYLPTLKGIGIGAPNGNFYHGSIDFAPNMPWKGKILLCQMFEAQFKIRAVLSNDANAAAIGEKIFGAGKEFKNFVLITLGTGLGSGVIINGELLLGTNGYAGEYGHIRVVKDGRACKCGRRGCLETYASATGVMKTYEEYKASFPHSSLASYDTVNSKVIFDEAKIGDELANKIVDFTADILGDSLADFACFSDPQAFILFGGITHSGDDFIDKVSQAMNANLLNIFKDKIVVKRTALEGDVSPLLGAAAVFLSTENKH